jgi:prephenate dehydrogenase
MSARPTSAATVTIVGLGMMGSSLGLAIAGAVAHRIGVDIDQDAADTARGMGAIDTLAPLAAAVADSDFVVLATPVLTTIELTPAISEALRPGAVLTDLGSTKRAVCEAFGSLDGAAIGGHPMCGSERAGPSAARADLFHGATWAIAAAQPDDPAAPAARVAELASAAGAHPAWVDPELHDRAVASASHLPYVLAACLVANLAAADQQTDDLASQLASTGFASSTRLAAGDATMWRDVLATNGDNLRIAIDDLRAELDTVELALDGGPESIGAHLEARRALRDRLPRR